MPTTDSCRISNKPVVCEPMKDGVKLVDRIAEVKPKRVLLIFWHGLGDLMMFLPVLEAIRLVYSHAEYPAPPGRSPISCLRMVQDIAFDLGLPLGLKYEQIVPEAVLLTGEQVNEKADKLPYDLVVKITFPMNEGQQEYTKGEWCCLHEIGIPPVSGHAELPGIQTRLVAVHFQITCLPDSANPDAATAERVWNDILEAGFVPLEVHFQHVFHNPANTKFPFIDATVRRCRADVGSLVGLIRNAAAFIGVVSGPFHVAVASLPPERVLLLEKDFKRGSFTKLPIATADLRDYRGEVKEFLEALLHKA